MFFHVLNNHKNLIIIEAIENVHLGQGALTQSYTFSHDHLQAELVGAS